MPSNHSQFMGFFVVFAILVLTLRVRIHRVLKNVCILFVVTLTLTVCYSRTELGFHTVDQVVAGLIFGALFGLIWFVFAHWFLFPKYPMIVRSFFGQLLLLRDGTNVDDVVAFEHQAYFKASASSTYIHSILCSQV
mmetsp:Transcript_26057/g.68579  ORF Transcript_26057/g.68579 Transcript_26057/m.68579 type:complete len:136 (-) Transcript_26057:33-440(-)